MRNPIWLKASENSWFQEISISFQQPPFPLYEFRLHNKLYTKLPHDDKLTWQSNRTNPKGHHPPVKFWHVVSNHPRKCQPGTHTLNLMIKCTFLYKKLCIVICVFNIVGWLPNQICIPIFRVEGQTNTIFSFEFPTPSLCVPCKSGGGNARF